jgi:TonB family protein
VQPPGALGGPPASSSRSAASSASSTRRHTSSGRRHRQLPGYPAGGSNCQYKSAEVDLEIGLRESGELQYVKIVRSSGIELYDSYAVNAVRLAAPYPPVTVSMLARGERESEAISTTGLRAGVSKPGAWINARFTYGPQAQVTPGAGR